VVSLLDRERSEKREREDKRFRVIGTVSSWVLAPANTDRS